MKSSHLALLFSSILTFIFFLILWVVDYSPFNIPEIIPVLELQTYSVLTFLAIIVAVIVFQKQLIKHNTNVSIPRLVLLSVLVCLTAQSIFQVVRQFYVLRFNDNNKQYDLIITLISMTVLSSILSLSIALEIRKAKQIWRTLSTAVAIIAFFIIKKYLPTITW